MACKNTPASRPVLTREECRAADGYAIQELGIPGALLMENAGRNGSDAVVRCLRRRLGQRGTAGRVTVVCGRGNNGGDGFVIARHLALRGHRVTIELLTAPEKLGGDAALNYQIVSTMGLPIRRLTGARAMAAAVRRWKKADVLVDAMLGTGFSGRVREPLAGVIRRINALDGPTVVAVDIPSGLDADTGEPGGDAIRADHTVTFLAAKLGCTQRSAKPFVGRLTVADIGAPLELILDKLGLRPRQ